MTLRKWRLAAAFLALCLFAVLFLAPGLFTNVARRGVLSSQLTPNLSYFGPELAIALLILLATLFLGRVYCSLLCPAGLLQELFHRLGGWLGLRRLRFARRGHPLLLLAGVGAAALLGFAFLISFLDPLGLFGRLAVVTRMAKPGLDAPGVAVIAMIGAGAILLVIVPLFRGRWFCDRLCPTGALMGLVSSASGRGVVMDADICVSCGKCEKICPVRAADAVGKRIDRSRCVLCLDCMDACRVGALAFGAKRPEERRDFLRAAATAAAGGVFALARPLAQTLGTAAAGDPGVMPPGAMSYDRHRARCVSCQSCVVACPVGIVQIKKPDLRPVLDYDRGFCQYSCVECARACPADALAHGMGVEEKQRTRIARTELVVDRCVVVTQGTSCGACAEVCPTHAVRMRDQGANLPTLPDFAAENCIGCGACYHACPVEPRAFIIEGLARHEQSAGVRPGGHAQEPPPSDSQGGGALQEFPF